MSEHERPPIDPTNGDPFPELWSQDELNQMDAEEPTLTAIERVIAVAISVGIGMGIGWLILRLFS